MFGTKKGQVAHQMNARQLHQFKKFVVIAVVAVVSGLFTNSLGVSAKSTDRSDYIVVFAGDAGVERGEQVITSVGGAVFARFEHVFKGVAVTLPDTAVEALSRRPEVMLIEKDQEISIYDIQQDATWGLDRIDQPSLPLNAQYVFSNDGTYASGAKRVDAYIIDTGILSTHVEFAKRVGTGFTWIQDRRGTTDCNGHGTHVAGIVGGTVYGVAKGVMLVPVRVLDCRGSGTVSGVVAGIDWVAKHHQPGVPAVANMSLGGQLSSALDTAVTNLVTDGVVVMVAAGNSNTDACFTSPASTSVALTVGATTAEDSRASYSNYGRCLDLFAPGSSITSAWVTNNRSVNTISGTSMAAPHVTGVAALVLSQYPTATVSDVTTKILAAATPDKLSNAGAESPNRLLYSRVS